MINKQAYYKIITQIVDFIRVINNNNSVVTWRSAAAAPHCDHGDIWNLEFSQASSVKDSFFVLPYQGRFSDVIEKKCSLKALGNVK